MDDDTKSMRSLGSERTQIDDEDYHHAATYEDTNDVVRMADIGWKKLLLVQFETVFELLVMFSSFISFGPNLWELIFYICDNSRKLDYRTSYVVLLFFLDIVYLLDAILMAIYKHTGWSEMRHLHKSRTSLAICMDFVSVFPSDIIYFALSRDKIQERILLLLRLRYTLRIYRVVVKLIEIENNIRISPRICACLQFAFTLVMSIQLMACVYFLLNCYSKDCDVVNDFIGYIYFATAKIVLRGNVEEPKNDYDFLTNTLYCLGNLLAFFYMRCYIVAKFISVIKQENQSYAAYSNRICQIISTYKNVFKEDALLQQTCENYYLLFWKYRKGVQTPNMQGIIPDINIAEIRLDLTYSAFMHSHLFRKENSTFLHFLSRFFENTFVAPGEVLYRKSQVKDKMIYLISGVIQIFSEDDGETPILSFSNGTVLGEMALMLSCRSICTVVCLTYCELSVLKRQDFVAVMHKYPKVFKRLRGRLFSRVEKAKDYVRVSRYERYKNAVDVKAGVLSIKRLKFTLRKMLAHDDTYLSTYIKKLELDERLWIENVNKLVFCPWYLDMLTLKDDQDINLDSVFISDKFPYVFQPYSVVIRFWRKTVAVLVLVLIITFPYYTIFSTTYSNVFNAFLIFIAIIWILDIYIQISTAIDIDSSLITQPKDIALARGCTIPFYLDLIAAIPLEIFLTALTGGSAHGWGITLQLNRMLKVHHIANLFEQNRKSITHDMVVSRWIKYSAYFALLVYWVAALHHLLLTLDESGTSSYHYLLIDMLDLRTVTRQIIGCIYFATMVVTGLSFYLPPTPGKSSDLFHIPLTLICIFCTVCYVYFSADLCSAETLKAHDKLKAQEQLKSTQILVGNLDASLTNAIRKYFDHQWRVNKAKNIVYLNTIIFDMPRNMFDVIRYQLLVKTLLKVPLFQEIEASLLVRLCSSMRVHDIPPGQIMVYAGEASAAMYIIESGFCYQMSPDRTIQVVIGPGESFTVVECCMQVPALNTIVTITSCRLLTVSYGRFTNCFIPYTQHSDELREVVEQCMISARFEEGNRVVDEQMMVWDKRREKSFVNFGYKLSPNTPQHDAYHTSFDRLGYWGFIRYLLLRTTFTSYGRFLWYWEIGRCIFAFCSAIFYSLPVLNSVFNFHPYYFHLILDIPAFVDIYLRHHVCYFNEMGIEVTHPLKTAAHYWSHGLLIDFLGCVPIEVILLLVYGRDEEEFCLYYGGLNRVLQTYRIWLVFQYKMQDVNANLRLLVPLRWVPFCFIAVIYIGNILLRFYCTFDIRIPASKNFKQGVKCDADTWISESQFKKPLTPIDVFVYGTYFVATIVTGIGLQGFDITNSTEALLCAILSFFGFLAFELISARIIGVNMSRDRDLMIYQHDMSSLMHFFTYKKIDQRIKDEIVEHFEYVFRKKRGKRYPVIMRCFNNALKEDILYKLFGETLKNSAIFEQANISFFRSLLLECNHLIIIRRGVISRVNDIHGNIFIIHKGQVDVLAPDNSQILVLRVGSMFGNLDNVPYDRRTLTMVAKGHVELLQIGTLDFYRIIKKYMRLYAHFRKLTLVHTDYLTGGTPVAVAKEGKDVGAKSLMNSKFWQSFQNGKHCFFKVRYKTASMKTWEVIAQSCGMLCFLLELYQKAVMEGNIFFVFALYFLDAIQILKIYFKFQTVYEDEVGLTITDLSKIARNYIRTVYFYTDIISVIPLEIFSLIFLSNWLTMFKIWSYARCNRIAVIFSVLIYLHKLNHKINVNVYFIRSFILVVWMLTCLQIFTCILIRINCTNDDYNASPHFSCAFYTTLTPYGKLELYIFYVGVATSIFTGTQSLGFYPESEAMTLCTIFLMIWSRIIMALFVAEACATFEVTMHTKNAYSHNVTKIDQHIKTLNVSRPLRRHFLKYCQLLWQKQKGLLFPKILDQAPYYLREAALNSMFGSHIRKHPILRGCHIDLVRQMAEKMRTNSFFPGDYITFKGEIDECMYFIHEGTVVALSEDTMYKETIEDTLTAGMMFGFEQGMYPACGQEYTYKATIYTVVVILKRSDWIFLLDFFPASKELIYDEKRMKEIQENENMFD